MKIRSLGKKIGTLSAVLALLVMVLNFGSYNPYNELSVMFPDKVLAVTESDEFDESGFGDQSDGFSSSSSSSGSSYSESNTSSNFSGSCNLSASAEEIHVGSNVTISWTTTGFSKIVLNGEELNNNSGSRTFNNLQENTTYTLEATSADGKNNCVSVVKVVCIPNPSPTPTCNLTPNHKVVSAGDFVEFVWTTTNSDSVTFTDHGAVDLNGSVTAGPINNVKAYELEVTGLNGEKVSCYSEIEVEKPASYCELTLTKEVDLDNAKPGDELTYVINIKNTGTADCTGGGVKIVDELDSNISFISETHSDNLSAGYNNYPPYQESTRKLFWNAYDLEPGEEGVITWKGKINESLACGSVTLVKNKARATARELNHFSDWSYSNLVETEVYESCPAPAPKCDMFTVTPDTITEGNSAELTWETANATRVTINNGVGEVADTGSVSVTPLESIEYLLTVFGENDQRDTCKVALTVKKKPEEKTPMCLTFVAEPASLSYEGGQSKLSWTTKNATGVTIDGIGEVASSGFEMVDVATTTTYMLTAFDDHNEHVCYTTVNVAPKPTPKPAPICTLNPENKTIDQNEAVELTWTTTNAVSATLTDFGEVDLNGSTSTGALADDKVYDLTVVGENDETVMCRSDIKVETDDDDGNGGGTGGGGVGGGGGGSSSPRCDLSVSDNKIKAGEEIELIWSSSHASGLKLVDSERNVLVDTDQFLNRDKEEWFDGEMTVSPTVDTAYLLTVERGSRDRECRVEVEVEGEKNDPVVITEIRDQQPLISGIALSDVPYTGFEAGPILTTLFYSLLVAWAFYIAYLLVIRRDVMGGYQLATPDMSSDYGSADISSANHASTDTDVDTDTMDDDESLDSGIVSSAPLNLPVDRKEPATIERGGVGYVASASSVELQQTRDQVATEIENYAHEQHILLSSGAIRNFIAAVGDTENKMELLDQVIVSAKTKFPAEDGWIVINENRMRDLCEVCKNIKANSNEVPYSPVMIPAGSGSLAEAIVTGNVVAAYELLGNRPMFALADAASDLDMVYRIRQGEEGHVSDMLSKETENLTDEQILGVIGALTGALDGTYTDEASAVKMAIMKAVKTVAA